MASLLKAFEDTSIFKGVLCFFDDNGIDYRFEREHDGVWRGFVLKGEAYVFECVFNAHKAERPRNLHRIFLRVVNRAKAEA